MPSFSVNADMSERVVYNELDFPVRTAGGDLTEFYGYSAACHWHQDFEALMPLDGCMEYFVNGQILHIQPGEAVFINSGRLHYGFSAAHQACSYRFVVYHPSLFGAYPPIQHLVERLTADISPDAFLLTPGTEEGREALACLRRATQPELERDALGLMSACAGLMRALCRINPARDQGAYDESWALLRVMTGFIQAHYQEEIRLDDIASSAAVCRSKCCRLFREKLNCSPGAYVTRYRLGKACAMLREGSSVSEAAFSAGFNGLSYFSETFRREFGITPKMYKEMKG